MNKDKDQIVITIDNLKKTFSGVPVLKGIDLVLRSGEVHAIVGANGAGKSTFIKVISGVFPHYSGTIRINGKEVFLDSPLKAFDAGISTVYQEVDTALIPYFTVAENLFLFHKRKDKWVTQSAFLHESQKVLESSNLSFSLPLKRKVSMLSVAEKQILIVTRALLFSEFMNFIIFDEPTASLSLKETRELFDMIRTLRKENIGVIYISHRMPEIFDIADKVTVFRDGHKIKTHDVKEITSKDIVHEMFGDVEMGKFSTENAFIGNKKALTVSELYRENRVDGVSFCVKNGEILGITGLVGAGKTELAEVLFGITPAQGGKIMLEEKEIHISKPSEAIEQGIFLVPEERHKSGLILDRSISWNMALSNFKLLSSGVIVKERLVQKISQKFIKDLKVVCKGPKQVVNTLSGGNQQKVSIGKFLVRDYLSGAKVFIFDEPTKGIDVEAKEEIYILMRELSSKGYGIIFLSSDIDEVIKVADRLLVMYNHRIVGETERKDINREKVLHLAASGTTYENEPVENISGN